MSVPVFTTQALLQSSCVAVCRSGSCVVTSIHYHSSALDQVLPQRPSLGWLANYSTHLSKTHKYTTMGKQGILTTQEPHSGGRHLHVWTRGGCFGTPKTGLWIFYILFWNPARLNGTEVKCMHNKTKHAWIFFGVLRWCTVVWLRSHSIQSYTWTQQQDPNSWVWSVSAQTYK